MPQSELLQIFDALNQAGVRYLVAGGVAAVLHGSPRFTADLDLVVSLQPDNLPPVVSAFESLGFKPRGPVPIAAFADPVQRESCVEQMDAMVVSLRCPTSPLTEVDLFAREPFVFDDASAQAYMPIVAGVPVHVLGLGDLLALKRAAGRPKDLEDVAALEQIRDAEKR